MKSFSLFAALVVLAGFVAGCSTDQHPILLVGASEPDATTCVATGTPLLERGMVDVSATQHYFLGVNWQSVAQPQTTSVGGQTVSSSSQIFYGEQVVFTYTSNPKATFADEAENISVVTNPTASASGNSFVVDLLQPKALATLQTLVPTGSAPAELDVTIQVKGHFEDGSSADSNKFTFPIDVTNTGFNGTCTTGAPSAPTACGNVQDEPACQ